MWNCYCVCVCVCVCVSETIRVTDNNRKWGDVWLHAFFNLGMQLGSFTSRPHIPGEAAKSTSWMWGQIGAGSVLKMWRSKMCPDGSWTPIPGASAGGVVISRDTSLLHRYVSAIYMLYHPYDISRENAAQQYTGWSKSLCASDDYSTKNMQKHFKQFQSLTTIT
jgi:hypothetical protein